jgi:type III secretion protein T
VHLDPATFAQARLWLVALVYAGARLQVALAIIPLFASAVVPGMVRTAIGVSLSLVLVPPMHAALGGHMPDSITMAAVVVKESFLGLLIGYSVAVLFWAVEGIGFFIDNQRGATIASTLNPLTGNDTSPLGILFNQAFIVYFLVAGGLTVFMTLVYQSFLLWPATAMLPPLPQVGTQVFAGMFGGLVRLTLLLSAPVIVALLLAELGLALVSRFAPQLQVFFLAMPVKSALALLILAVYVPTLFDYLHDEIAHLPDLLVQLTRGLR